MAGILKLFLRAVSRNAHGKEVNYFDFGQRLRPRLAMPMLQTVIKHLNVYFFLKGFTFLNLF